MSLDVLRFSLNFFYFLVNGLGALFLVGLVFWLYIKERTKIICLLKNKDHKSLRACKNFNNFPSFYSRSWRIVSTFIFVFFIPDILESVLNFVNYNEDILNISR